ncbi:MAG TPA: DUF5686 family protein [bacterium]|nr:DUF5686 family protein [bacterium]HPN43777.1 DUF5686 family protein [bacterium]
MSKTVLRLFMLLVISVSAGNAEPLKIIHGLVTDKTTGTPLPNANIEIVGAYRGTITNSAGFYRLEIPELPAVVRVRYIGYSSVECPIGQNDAAELNIAMQPIVIQMPEIVVTDEDPAVEIMRQVIKKKQQWRKSMHNFQTDAYSRFTLNNDTSVVVLMESTSEFYWDAQSGSREIIKSKKVTKNLDEDFPAMPASSIQNFYDDELFIQESRIPGPTHPDAVDYYRFRLVGQRSLDDKLVFDISLSPRNKLQPGLVGTLSVLDGDFAMIAIDVRPSEAVRFPFPINHFNISYKQQYSNYGGNYWLPVDERVNGDIKFKMPGLIEFPNIYFHQLCRLTNYQLNTTLPDTLFKDQEKKHQVIQTTAARDTLLTDKLQTIPLTALEEKAYTHIDSSKKILESFPPRGILSHVVKMQVHAQDETGKKHELQKTDNADSSGTAKSSKKHTIKTSFKPKFHYNRVAAYRFGLHTGVSFGERFDLLPFVGYSTGLKKWDWGVKGTLYLQKEKQLYISAGYKEGTEQRYSSEIYPPLYNSLLVLCGYTDYFDYYRNRAVTVAIGKTLPGWQSKIELGLNAEKHSALEKQTDKNWLNRKITQPVNPAVMEADIRSLSLHAQYGEDFTPLPVSEQKRILLTMEYSDKNLLSSAYDYILYRLTVDWRIPTLLRRRFMPNVLDARFVAGAATGQPPIEKLGGLDVSTGLYSPFGIFKTLRKRPLDGDKYCALFWEHNFRTVPFELVGLNWIADHNIGIILHGASGRTWNAHTEWPGTNFTPNAMNDWYHEIGLSLNGLFGFFRLDVTRPVDKDEYYFGVSAARMF